MNALEALGARAAGGLQHGESYDDPAGKVVSKLLQAAGGDHKLAAKAAWNQRERARKRTNMAGGQSLLQVENETRFGGGDAQAMQVATRLNNLAASKGKTQGAYGSTPDPRANDPRLSTQGRAQLGRVVQDAAARQAQETLRAQSAADTEARNQAERRRITTEGDAWLAQMPFARALAAR